MYLRINMNTLTDKGLLLLRAGIAFSFLYAAIAGFINPEAWIGWLPRFLQKQAILTSFGVGEIILAFWLLSGWRTFLAAIISGFMLFGIVVLNFQAMLIVFRDASLAMAAFALAILTYPKKYEGAENTAQRQEF